MYSDLQLLSDEGEVVRVAMAAMRSVQVLDPRKALRAILSLCLSLCLSLSLSLSLKPEPEPEP